MRRRDPDELTDRERDVLALLRRDFTNEQIAQRLGISADGAKYHVSQILSKLGVTTREEAAAWRPEGQRSGYWKWALIGGLGAIGAIATSALVLAIPGGGNDVQLESEVLARGSETKATQSQSVARATPRPAPVGESPAPTTASHIIAPNTVDPEVDAAAPPSDEATPPPSEPTPTPELLETPRPTDCGCSGIEGRVVQSPICGPDSYPPLPGCEPQPYQATIVVLNADRTQELLRFTTDEQGNFRVPLVEGSYHIEPQGSGLPHAPDPFLVTVPPDRFVQLVIDYFTGIL